MPYLEMQALSDIRPLAEFGATEGSMAIANTIEIEGPDYYK
jgi:hypothetical protein